MKKFKIGLQLYSIREDMEKDMENALKKVKEIGYDYVEFAGYFGHSAEEVKAMLDKYGLECVSVHQTPQLFADEGQKAVDYLKTIGAKYCAIPWYDADKHAGTENWDNTVELFSKVGKLLKENGIQQLYHNHDFEFKKFENKFLLDWLYETIPADFLQPQVDTCWVRYAGYDPAEYIEKYAGRIKVIHLKDYVCKKRNDGPAYALIGEDGTEEKEASKEDNGFEFRPLGMGVQNIPAILEVADKIDADILIVEQDLSVSRPPLEAAEISRKYLKTLGI
ncbi:MAG: sugar phosphate isomerase/epimerase [Clostridia bacterium]|nr:sugar phosphate isomerase/epimerase [Clostridia bacterium]